MPDASFALNARNQKEGLIFGFAEHFTSAHRAGQQSHRDRGCQT
jgi:hypothetical protein